VRLDVGTDALGEAGVSLRRASAPEIEAALAEHRDRLEANARKRRDVADAFADETRARGNHTPHLHGSLLPGSSAGLFRGVVPKDSRVLRLRDVAEATAQREGYKAASCGDLARVAARPNSGFRAVRGVTLPFGCFELCAKDQGLYGQLEGFLRTIDDAAHAGDPAALRVACREARALARKTVPPPDIAATVCASFVGEDILEDDAHGETPNYRTLRSTTRVPLLVVRASMDIEDPACAGGDRASSRVARDFDSEFDSEFDFGFGVSAARSRDVAEAVSAAWASAFTPQQALRRVIAGGASMRDARVAVLVQPLAPGGTCFAVRTERAADSRDSREARRASEVSVGPGFGGWSRNAREGEPWIVTVDREDGETVTETFASIDACLRVENSGKVRLEPVEYASEPLSAGPEASELRARLARRLAAVGAVLEAEFGTPQLVEGCVVGDTVFVTRTRPQQP
jgi:phosphoglucan,water dikinase